MFDDNNPSTDTGMDSSILSGASTPNDTGAAVIPMPPTAPPSPSPSPSPTSSQTAASAPSQSQATYNPMLSGDIPPVPQAQGTPSVWKNIVMGAIYGLAGSAGAKHFGAGLAGGAAGVVNEDQQQVINRENAQKLNFESLQAADSHIAALDEHRRADQLSDAAKLDYKQKSAEYQDFLQQNFGIEPDLSFNDSHTDAVAALGTASQANGGTIPPVATVQQPSPDGEHGTIAAYSPSQQKFQQNMNGYRDLINTAREVQGLPDIDDQTFNSLGFKGARDQAQKAIEFMKPTPAYTLDKTKPDYLPVVLAQKQQQLQQYEAHKDVNGKPDADPAVVKQLQNGIDFLESAWDSSNKMENDQQVGNLNATAGAQASAAGQKAKSEELAREQTPGGQAELADKEAQTQKAEFELGQEKREATQLSQPDATGFSSQLTAKEYDKRYDAFTKSKEYTTLQTLQGSYQQFQSVKADLDAGRDMTGAQSVVGLFNAIGISATPLAGKGMRINQNTIEEHVGARGIDQAAYQKLLSLKNGDVITPQQLRDYSTIATQVYRDSYVNAVDEAHRQGLPADFLPKGGGQKVDGPTADIFARSVLHTNPQLANNPAALKQAVATALQANGWTVQ